MERDQIIRRLDKGIIKGCHWPVDHPKKVICLIHGMGEYARRYQRIAGFFNDAGHCVMSMDLRGHGLSAGKRGDCAPRDQVLEDVNALLSLAARTYPSNEIVLYGHSLGGNIVLDHRARGVFRDLPAGYIVSSPWIRLTRPVPKAFYRFAKAMSHLAPTLTIGSNINASNLGNPDNILPYHDDPLIHNRISLRCAVESFEVGKAMEEGGAARTDEKTGKIPTLMMHGGQDRICDINGTRSVYEDLRRSGENVQFKEFPDLFHELHNGGEKSDGTEVIDWMIRFLDSI